MDVLNAILRATAVIGVLAAGSGGVRAAQQTLEPDVKAAYLYNFTRYVEWPAEADRGSEPFRICVLADPAIRNAIQRTVQGETVHGRPLVMVAPETPRDAQQCQILYVGRSDQQRAGTLLAAVRDLPVLTVGDSSRFTEQGGMIEFLLQDNRVRFDVNLPRAQQSKLRVSSNLLRVARKVLEPPR
jgi:hypothetical protein